ncbi:MAG: hypothetical protein PHQ27_01935 [Victivallales bacterium]|nr:hypothetical protein [Victivallales bacterium]
MKRMMIGAAGFLVMGVLWFFLAGTYWGVWGEIGPGHFTLILKSLPSWQKYELAEALNTPTAAAMAGVRARAPYCVATTAGIAGQINWFFRHLDTPVAAAGTPSYSRLVREVYYRVFRHEFGRMRYESTIDYELALARRYRSGNNSLSPAPSTAAGAAGTAVDARSGSSLPSAAINPFLGAVAQTLLRFRETRDDAARVVPGIVCFMRLRCRNFIYTFAALWLLTGVVMVLIGCRGGGKDKKKKKKKKSGKSTSSASDMTKKASRNKIRPGTRR